jgi:putative sugar O-methyltransferase
LEELDKENVHTRLKKFIHSEEYGINASNKSPYWNQHVTSIAINVDGDSVTGRGSSGDTKPFKRNFISFMERNKMRALAFFKKPTRSINKLFLLIFMTGKINLLSKKDAFNSIMSGEIFKQGHIYYKYSPCHLDLDEFISNKNLFQNTKDIERTSIYKKGFGINDHLIKTCYHYNVLKHTLLSKEIKTVVEIGAGSGIFLSLIKDAYPQSTIVDIDLPESIAHAIVFINTLYPNAKMLLPHEELNENISEYDFIFRTPDQIKDIPDQIVDLSINTMSFMEMNYSSVESYLGDIQRWSKSGAFLFSSNRVEKIPYSKATTDNLETVEASYEADYPWRDNETILLETDKLVRLTSLDNAMIRVQRILKV